MIVLTSDGRWPPSGPLYQAAVALQAATERAAKPGGSRGQRTAQAEMVIARRDALRPQVAAEATQLEREDRWLFKHPTHKKFTTREDDWLGRLGGYEAACDALRASERVVAT